MKMKNNKVTKSYQICPIQEYLIHFYLADDSVEVREVRSGKQIYNLDQ